MKKQTKKIKIGDRFIGGGEDILIQSMTNTKTADVLATVAQIKELEAAGCEIVRVAVPDIQSAKAISEIKSQIGIPLVADVHFDYKLAVASIENGVDKLRINPGNIGGFEKVSIIAEAAKEKGIAIRVGVNAGSFERGLLEKFGGVTAEAMAESALNHVEMLERCGFYNTVIAIKSSSALLTVKAYKLLSEKTDYPLHLGITEAGLPERAVVKSAVGIGALLLDGIGDTLRVSITGDPVSEVECAKNILMAAECRKFGVEVIACPTCGRTEIDLIGLARRIEKECAGIKKNIKVAVMGCIVNGPGEARAADIGVAGGRGVGIIFRSGEIIKKVPEAEIEEQLMKAIAEL